MPIITYKVTHKPTYGEVTVMIDFNTIFYKDSDNQKTAEESIVEMVNFWDGGDKRMEANDGVWLNTFLKQLCEKVMCLVYEHNYNLSGLISAFNQLEGWEPMDGSTGFKITDFIAPILHKQSDYEIFEFPF